MRVLEAPAVVVIAGFFFMLMMCAVNMLVAMRMIIAMRVRRCVIVMTMPVLRGTGAKMHAGLILRRRGR